MSSKFEQLLDLLVNEEHEKANELFHEIVIEKSREIYDTMIAEEAKEEDEEEMDEARDEEDDESVEESSEDEEEDESVEEGFGDSEESMYEIGGEEELGGDASDDLVHDIEDHDAMGQDDEEGGDEPATKDDVLDIADALEELKAEFQALLAGEKHEEEENPDIHGGALDSLDSEEDSEEDDEEADEQFMREYREVVGKPYAGGKVAGKSEEASTNKSSVVSSAKGRPSSDATAHNITQGGKGEGAMDGERTNAGAIPKSLAGGVKGEFTKGVEKNISSKSTTSMKDGGALNKVAAGHGAEKKGSGEVGGTNTKPIVDKKQ